VRHDIIFVSWAELDDAVSKIEDSTLKLLKLEKSFLKTATIVSEVIDDLVSDFEDDEEAGLQPPVDTGTCPTKGSGDATSSTGPLEPYVFQLSKKNLVSVANFKDKLATVFPNCQIRNFMVISFYLDA